MGLSSIHSCLNRGMQPSSVDRSRGRGGVTAREEEDADGRDDEGGPGGWDGEQLSLSWRARVTWFLAE